MDNLKELIRKFEQDVQKWQDENKLLQNEELKAKNNFTQEINKCHILEKELKDAQIQIDDLKSKFIIIFFYNIK